MERAKPSAYGDIYLFNGASDLNDAGGDWSADGDQQSDVGNTHWYTGRERDPETGLQLNRHRFYASHLGRWVNRDPIEYEGNQWNLYEYVGSKPVIIRDSTGLIPIDCECYGGFRNPIQMECVDCEGLASTCCEQVCSDNGYEWPPKGGSFHPGGWSIRRTPCCPPPPPNKKYVGGPHPIFGLIAPGPKPTLTAHKDALRTVHELVGKLPKP